MMQMLDRGGMEVVTDGQRIADDDNPAGYYEYEPVKMLQRDATWLALARGKAVKIISQLLFDLPASERYAIILMQRHIEEVLASQDKMLARRGQKAASHDVLRSAFESHQVKLGKWLSEQSNFRVLKVEYAGLIADPAAYAMQVAEFVGQPLSFDAMAAAVDPSLYRNRGV